MDKQRGLGRWAVWAMLFAALAGLAGCTRGFYRRTADREVKDILAEKDRDERWRLEQWHVYPDPRARFADPHNPDREPMPPDDEGAWMYGPHPQKPGHKGVAITQNLAYLEILKAWDAQNRTEGLPEADHAKRPIKTYFDEPLKAPDSGFLLKLDQAIELGVVNSPNYQSFREGLYSAALPVTQQRFAYAYQWAAIADWVRQWAGPNATGGPQNNWTGTSTIGFSKLFSTGALLTADLTNTTIVNFLNSGVTTSSSVIGATLTQPLLQGGGKAVTLEPLTLAERNLLYSMRSYARFREQFNVQVALGASPPSSLQSAVNGTGGTGPISALASLGVASTDVGGGFAGYLQGLFRETNLAADKKLVKDLEKALKIIESYQEGGMFSPLQVEQVRSQLLQAQNRVLTDVQFVMNSLDQFKLVLGLPANTPIILDDMTARPITTQLDHYYELLDDAEEAARKLDAQEALPPEKLRGFIAQETFAKSALVQGTEFAKKIVTSLAEWQKTPTNELKKRKEMFDAERRKLLDRKTDLELKDQKLSPAELQKLREVEFEADIGTVEQLLRRYESKPWEKMPKAIDEKTKKDQAFIERVKQFRAVATAVKATLVWARNDRFDAVITQWPEIPPAMLGDLDLVTADVEQAQALAIQAAHTNRLDLMNARAQLVDSWRQLRVTANSLLGVATVEYTVQAQTPLTGSHPLAFTTSAASNQMRLNFQLPLNRVAERNAYRQAVINYQAARRGLQNLEDNIAAQVRFDVRQLQLFAANYKIQKALVHSLYSQLENAQEVIVSPTDPDALKGSSTGGAAAAAALTNQYLGSLQSLNNAQIRMYQLWLSIYATRMQLYLDLERLPLDVRGVWTDNLLAPPFMVDRDGAPVHEPTSREADPRLRPTFLRPRVVTE